MTFRPCRAGVSCFSWMVVALGEATVVGLSASLVVAEEGMLGGKCEGSLGVMRTPPRPLQSLPLT